MVDQAIHLTRVGGEKRREALSAEKLEDRAIAVADFDDVIGDRGRDAFNEGFAREFAFALDFRKGVNVVVDLDDGVGVDEVDLAVAALADDFAALKPRSPDQPSERGSSR